MYFSSSFLVFVHLSSVVAIHPFVLSNPHHKRNHSLNRLQYRVPRALIDTCVSLDADVSFDALQQLSILEPLLAPLATSAATDLCLCLKDLDISLGTNTSVQALNEISAILAAVIQTSPDSRQCDLPPNAKRSCTNSDPCRWTCETNFTREDDTCVCSPPNRICNGICSESCGVIPSSVPRLSKTKYKRQQRVDSYAGDAVVYPDDSLLDQLASILKLAVELKLGGSRLSTSPASYEGILYPVMQSVAGLLNSPQVASLFTNTNNLLDSLSASLKTSNDCNCINSLDMRDLVAQLEAMLARTVNLRQRLATNLIGTIGTTSNSTSNRATMSNSSNLPIVLNLSGLLDSLGLYIDLGTVNDLVAFLLGGFGMTDATASGSPLLETNVAINLNALLDSILRLVLDLLQLNVSSDLKAHVSDIAKVTDDYVDSILNGRPLDLELSILLDLTRTAKDISGPPLVSINLDLDHILDILAAMTHQPPPAGYIEGFDDRKSLLNDLEVKRHRIDTAVKGLGPAINLDSPLLSASIDIGL